ncbi:four helix bundle protein [Cytobacillus gottheilii]|uniref:four helix bundle protein n=1 Tax=Cytobacillus gottheilii TaxID=859144 RepID=UPI00083002B6|nr:four helix bundle protein [Cytobacillus gottheilii]
MKISKKRYVGNVRDLKVYRKALLFCKVMYEISKRLPPEESYLADLLKRSSCSVVANLAEGNTNFYHRKELNHLNSSISKVAEIRAGLDLLRMQGYIDESVYKSSDLRGEEILKMIIKLMQRIESKLDQDDIDETEIVNKSVMLPIELSELIKKATLFNNHILEIVQQYPPIEKYGQIDQITRASKSILENLGNAQNASYPQKSLYLNTSLGSVSECKAFLDISVMQNYISTEQFYEISNLGDTLLDLIIELINHMEENNEKVYNEVS